jgi:predicted DNA-binding protein
MRIYGSPIRPETEQEPLRLARDTGRAAKDVVREAVERLIHDEAEFLSGVQEGFDSLARRAVAKAQHSGPS